MDNRYHYSTYSVPSTSFQIRHLKQGGTGARKTWPAAEVLLDYLLKGNGLKDPSERVGYSDAVLDLTDLHSNLPIESYRIVELGGGTGAVSIGLALSNHNLKILCTDNDKNTIKNMKHNVATLKVHKYVQTTNLEWNNRSTIAKSLVFFGSNATLQTVSHVIASDVHYGETTLEPLSTIVAGMKLENPGIHFILMLKERNEGAVANLQQAIEAKLRTQETTYPVRVRDVIRQGLDNMKVVEC